MKPTASPLLKRPWASSRAAGRDGAGAHARERLAERLGVLLDRDGPGASATAAASPACWLVVGATSTCLSESRRRVLGGHDHVGAVGQQHDLLGGHVVDARQQVVGGGVERRPAVDRVHAELGEHLAHARRR